jgi:hypothetical protein
VAAATATSAGNGIGEPIGRLPFSLSRGRSNERESGAELKRPGIPSRIRSGAPAHASGLLAASRGHAGTVLLPSPCDTERDEDRVKKYEELYRLAKEVVNRELDRAKRKDDQASRYFSVFSIVLGLTGTFGKSIIDRAVPPGDAFQWVCVLSGALFAVCMLAALLLALQALKAEPLHEISLTEELLTRFRFEPYLDALFALTRALAQAEERNRLLIDRKARKLELGHAFFVVALASLIVCVSAFAGQGWVVKTRAQARPAVTPRTIDPPTQIKQKGRSGMSTKQSTPRPAPPVQPQTAPAPRPHPPADIKPIDCLRTTKEAGKSDRKKD